MRNLIPTALAELRERLDDAEEARLALRQALPTDDGVADIAGALRDRLREAAAVADALAEDLAAVEGLVPVEPLEGL